MCQRLHSSEQEGWEELSKTGFPKLGGSRWGTGRETWAEAVRKHLPLVPAWVEEQERKAPSPLFLRRLKRKPKCGICVFHKNSKSSRSYCFHRKNVIRGSEKAHVGLGTSAAQSRLENNWAAAWQNKNAAVHVAGPAGNHGAEQAGAWPSVLLIPRSVGDSQRWEGAPGTWSRTTSLSRSYLPDWGVTQQQAARPTFRKQPSVLYRQVITNVLWRTVLPVLLQK